MVRRSRSRPLRVTLPPPSARWLPHQPTRSALVVSHHLDGLLRARVPGLVASRYRKGFAAFLAPAHRSRDPETVGYGATGSFPGCAFTPFEEVPPPAAAPHRCGRCLLAVGPPQTPLPVCAATLDLEALLRCRVRCDQRRCQRGSPSPSMGFVPLQGAGRDRRPTDRVSALARILLAPPARPGVATDPAPPAPLARPTAGVTDAVDRDIPPTDSATAVTSGASGSKSVRGSPFAIRPARRRAGARRGPVRDRGPSWGF